jgi:hypothetical protein
MQNEQDLVASLHKIDQALAGVHGGGKAAGAAAAGGAFNPCAEYKKIKPILDTVIKIAESLPFGVGKRIAAVLKALEAILDKLCP